MLYSFVPCLKPFSLSVSLPAVPLTEHELSAWVKEREELNLYTYNAEGFMQRDN